MMTQRMTIGILALFSTAVLSASQAPTPGQDSPRPTPGQETPRPPQTPPTQTTPATPSAPAGQAAAAGQMTMAGCLYREGQDWILADASMAGQAKPGATPGATGTTGSAAGGRFKVSSLPDDKLKDLSGKRVEVSGRIDQAARAAAGGAAKEAAGAGGAAGAGQAALQQFQASSIKEVSGTPCPATPAPAK